MSGLRSWCEPLAGRGGASSGVPIKHWDQSPAAIATRLFPGEPLRVTCLQLLLRSSPAAGVRPGADKPSPAQRAPGSSTGPAAGLKRQGFQAPPGGSQGPPLGQLLWHSGAGSRWFLGQPGQEVACPSAMDSGKGPGISPHHHPHDGLPTTASLPVLPPCMASGAAAGQEGAPGPAVFLQREISGSPQKSCTIPSSPLASDKRFGRSGGITLGKVGLNMVLCRFKFGRVFCRSCLGAWLLPSAIPIQGAAYPL